jgi:hypothetical protein
LADVGTATAAVTIKAASAAMEFGLSDDFMVVFRCVRDDSGLGGHCESFRLISWAPRNACLQGYKPSVAQDFRIPLFSMAHSSQCRECRLSRLSQRNPPQA